MVRTIPPSHAASAAPLVADACGEQTYMTMFRHFLHGGESAAAAMWGPLLLDELGSKYPSGDLPLCLAIALKKRAPRPSERVGPGSTLLTVTGRAGGELGQNHATTASCAVLVTP